jgi:hypothetical protein
MEGVCIPNLQLAKSLPSVRGAFRPKDRSFQPLSNFDKVYLINKLHLKDSFEIEHRLHRAAKGGAPNLQ